MLLYLYLENFYQSGINADFPSPMYYHLIIKIGVMCYMFEIGNIVQKPDLFRKSDTTNGMGRFLPLPLQPKLPVVWKAELNGQGSLKCLTNMTQVQMLKTSMVPGK